MLQLIFRLDGTSQDYLIAKKYDIFSSSASFLEL